MQLFSDGWNISQTEKTPGFDTTSGWLVENMLTVTSMEQYGSADGKLIYWI